MKLETMYLKPGSDPIGAVDQLDSTSTLVVLFGGRESSQMVKAVVDAFPNSVVIGCSTAGEVFGGSVYDGGLSVAVAQFERTRLRQASASVESSAGSYEAGTSIAEALTAEDLRAVFVLSDGTNVNGTSLIQGLNDALDPSVVVTGGLAGDSDRFEETWVVSDGKAQSDAITAVGLYGDHVRVGHGYQGGWDIFGPERLVTRSSENVLYELDGQPALQLYKTYLGDLASGLPATGLLFPLALRSNAGDEHSLVRTILGVDETEQSMTFAGDVPKGWTAQLMRANFDRLIEGAEGAASATVMSSSVDGECLGLAVSCVGRRLVLGERVEEELDAALEKLPSQTKLVGFYSYGEISPHVSGRCELHNQTMTLTTLSEDLSGV